jgi:hypothetical protein
MTFTEEHPRVDYLRQRVARDAGRAEVILKDALWRHLTGRDTYALPDTEEELDRLAQRLSALLDGGLGSRTGDMLARFEYVAA